MKLKKTQFNYSLSDASDLPPVAIIIYVISLCNKAHAHTL